MALFCPVNYSIWFFFFKNTPYKFLICYICAIKSNLFFNLLYSFQITCISKFINQNYFISLPYPLPDKFTPYKAGSACNKKLFHTASLLINSPERINLSTPSLQSGRVSLNSSDSLTLDIAEKYGLLAGALK